jgi:hypothetical protein
MVPYRFRQATRKSRKTLAKSSFFVLEVRSIFDIVNLKAAAFPGSAQPRIRNWQAAPAVTANRLFFADEATDLQHATDARAGSQGPAFSLHLQGGRLRAARAPSR